MAPFGGEPGVVEIQPADLRADVVGGLRGIEFERGIGHARAAGEFRTWHHGAEVPDAFLVVHRQRGAGKRVEQHEARRLEGFARTDAGLDDVIGHLRHFRVRRRTHGGTDRGVAHAGTRRVDPRRDGHGGPRRARPS